jgi:hypothetical protein
MDQLAQKFSRLSIFDPTRNSEVTVHHDSHPDMTFQSGLGATSEVQSGNLARFPLGLSNSASIYQDSINHLMQSEQEIPLMGAQTGLVLSITSEDGIVHWPGARLDISSADSSRLVSMVELLPFQDGSTLPTDSDDHDSIEILGIATTIELGMHLTTRHSREVFMAGQPPQIPMPTPPDI